MKHLCILFFMLLLPCCNIAASEEERVPNEYVFYDVDSGEPFVYNKTIEGRANIDFFNIPFAYNIVVNGQHLEFSITNEDFRWFVMRKSDTNYWDVEVCLYDSTHLGFNDKKRDPIMPVASVYVIRILFNR